MGIDGLLRNIKNCTTKREVKYYAGKTAAIDTYGWLHKIIKGQAGKDIIMGKNLNRFVDECMKRIDKLKKAGLKVIMVFDGGPLPRKSGQEETRKKRRQDNQKKGLQLCAAGESDAGMKKLVDAIDITPDVAFQLILQLKKNNIDFVVAPYQADAQLAYLNRAGIADLVITQDGDLLVFGAKRIIYKLDYFTMMGQEICLDEIKLSTGGLCFQWFTHCMFMTICIMAGCDYLSQITGIGLKTAHKIISKHMNLKNALSQIQASGKNIPLDYQTNFILAFLTFRFQRVYCPIKKKCVSINDFSILDTKIDDLPKLKELSWSNQVLDSYILNFAKNKITDWSFLGPYLDDEAARKIGQAEINPVTYKSYDYSPFSNINYSQQIKQLSKHSKKVKPFIQTPATENMLIDQFCQMKIQNGSSITTLQIKQRQLLTRENHNLDFSDQESRSNHFEEQFKNHQIKPRQSIIKKKRGLKINDSEQEDEQSEENEQYLQLESQERDEKSVSYVINLSDDQNEKSLYKSNFYENNKIIKEMKNAQPLEINQNQFQNEMEDYQYVENEIKINKKQILENMMKKVQFLTKPLFDEAYFINPFGRQRSYC